MSDPVKMPPTLDELRVMLQELDDVAAFTVDGKAAFMADMRTQKAVIRTYEVIGEIAKRLPAELRAANPQVDWHNLITFSDFLAHNYDEIELHFVWAAVEDVPNVRAAVAGLLADVEAESADDE